MVTNDVFFFFFVHFVLQPIFFKFARSREHSNDFKQRVVQEKTVFAMDMCAADQCQSDRPPHYVHNVITEKGKGGEGLKFCSFHSPKIDVLATNRIRWLAVQHSRELKASPQPVCTSSLVSKNAQSKINCTCMVRKRKAVESYSYIPFLAFLNYLNETTWNTCESAPSQKGRRVRPVAARDRVTFL